MEFLCVAVQFPQEAHDWQVKFKRSLFIDKTKHFIIAVQVKNTQLHMVVGVEIIRIFHQNNWLQAMLETFGLCLKENF